MDGWTDRQTDGRTHEDSKYRRASIALCGKNKCPVLELQGIQLGQQFLPFEDSQRAEN